MRLLGIDYGTKRVGLALSDENRQFAMPLIVVANVPDLTAEIISLAEKNETTEIVIGESKNYKGKDNPIQAKIEELKKHLEAKKFTVHYEPEFMTSVEAERLQGKNDKSDASAAALILQAYLDKQPK